MADLETRLRGLADQVDGGDPDLGDVEQRAGRLRRRRRIVQVAVPGIAVVLVAVVAVGLAGLLRSPAPVTVGPGEPVSTPAAATVPPEGIGNPGVVERQFDGRRVQVDLSVVPRVAVAPRDVGDLVTPTGSFDPVGETSPRWTLGNSGLSEIAVEYGAGIDVDRWTGQRWERLPGFPVDLSMHVLHPDEQDRSSRVPLVYPSDPDAFARAGGDPAALADALAPLEPGWYRAVKTMTPLLNGTSNDEPFEAYAAFRVVERRYAASLQDLPAASQLPPEGSAAALDDTQVDELVGKALEDPTVAAVLSQHRVDEVLVRPGGDNVGGDAWVAFLFPQPVKPEIDPYVEMCTTGGQTDRWQGIVARVDLANHEYTSSSPIWTTGANCASWPGTDEREN